MSAVTRSGSKIIEASNPTTLQEKMNAFYEDVEMR